MRLSVISHYQENSLIKCNVQNAIIHGLNYTANSHALGLNLMLASRKITISHQLKPKDQFRTLFLHKKLAPRSGTATEIQSDLCKVDTLWSLKTGRSLEVGHLIEDGII